MVCKEQVKNGKPTSIKECGCKETLTTERVFRMVLKALRSLNGGQGGTPVEILRYSKKFHVLEVSDDQFIGMVRNAARSGIQAGVLKLNNCTGRFYISRLSSTRCKKPAACPPPKSRCVPRANQNKPICIPKCPPTPCPRACPPTPCPPKCPPTPFVHRCPATPRPRPCPPTPCPKVCRETPPPCPPKCPPTCPPKCPPTCPPKCPPTCPPKCPPTCPPKCPPTCPPKCPPTCPPKRISQCPPRCPPTCPPKCPQTNPAKCALALKTSIKNVRCKRPATKNASPRRPKVHRVRREQN